MWVQLLRWQDSLGEPVLSFRLWIPRRNTGQQVCPAKHPPLAEPSDKPTYFFQARSYCRPGQPRTHHVAQASLCLLSAVAYHTPPLPACDTCFWKPFLEQVACNDLWILSQAIRTSAASSTYIVFQKLCSSCGYLQVLRRFWASSTEWILSTSLLYKPFPPQAQGKNYEHVCN